MLNLHYELKEDNIFYVTKDSVLVARVQFAFLNPEDEEYLSEYEKDMMWEIPYTNVWSVVSNQKEFEEKLCEHYGWKNAS